MVKPETSLEVQIGYGLFISTAHIVWLSLVAMCFSAGMVRDRLLNVRDWVDKTFGVLLIMFGALLAAASRMHEY